MKLLLFIFLIIRPEQYFFQQFIQNDTYAIENRLQQLHKSSENNSIKSILSNKIFLFSIPCLFIVIIATVLTIYLTKDQMKDFVNRMGINQRGPVIHEFNPHGLTLSNDQSHSRIPNDNNKLIFVNERQKREHTSNKYQQNSISDHRRSQSATDLFLYR
ncbi:unnamed protein product [Adineta steineri]|uniref:Uncharacterized protein n=1 Tax=Adineta steineri TaxID=433720 RepID=A0A814QMF9_9BILA|nr:unnamed protein product [Adineta steineri]CAF1122599.1 unnamed protein product [Adineta steineri]